MNVHIQSYAACIITSQEKRSEDLAKGTPTKKGLCVVVTQELEFILNLHLLSILMGNHYSRPACGGFLSLNLSNEYIILLYQQYVGIMVPSLIYG